MKQKYSYELEFPGYLKLMRLQGMGDKEGVKDLLDEKQPLIEKKGKG